MGITTLLSPLILMSCLLLRKNVSENQIAISDSPCKLNSITAVKKEFVKVEGSIGRNLFLNRNEGDDFDFTRKVQSVADLHEENTHVYCEDDDVLHPITSQSPVAENVVDDVSVNSDDDFEHPPQNGDWEKFCSVSRWETIYRSFRFWWCWSC